MRASVVRVRNQIEDLLEQAQIMLSSVVTDILGMSGRRMLGAPMRGNSDRAALAGLGGRRLHAGKDELADASGYLTETQRVAETVPRANRASVLHLRRQAQALARLCCNLWQGFALILSTSSLGPRDRRHQRTNRQTIAFHGPPVRNP